MDFEKLLKKCGDFGRYQFLILALFGFINIISAIHYFGQTVISLVPNHWCYHEKLVTKPYDEIAKIYADYEHPSCTRLIYTTYNSTDTSLSENVANWSMSNESCNRWIYEYDYGFRSMNVELNWVCDAAVNARVGQSLFYVGSLVGTLFLGTLSDHIGRLPALILANLLASVGDFATAFTTTVSMFSLCRFVSGLASDANFYLMMIMVLEYVSPSKRSACINASTGSFYAIGLVSTPWLAVLAGNWQRYLLGTSLPMLLVVLFYFVVQESAQWLITRNDIDGAVLRLERIARVNGRNVDPQDFLKFRQHCEQQHKQTLLKNNAKVPTLQDMFKTPRMRKITLILFFKSIVISLCYDVVARNVEGVGISPLLMLSINGLMVVPSFTLLVVLQDRLGRKAMASGSMFITGIVTIVAGVVIATQDLHDQKLLLVCLMLAARFGVGISYGSGALYATELIPTSVRGRGVAAVHVAGFAASGLSPYVLLLGTYCKLAPAIIQCVLFFLGSFVCLLLPETLNRTLPTTLEEGELFGIGERMFDFPCLRRDAEPEQTLSPAEHAKQGKSFMSAQLQEAAPKNITFE